MEASLAPLISMLRLSGASVVRHEVFGQLDARPAFFDAWHRAAGVVDWPVLWMESGLPEPVAGMHVLAVVGAPVRSVVLDGRVVARRFHDGELDHCLFGDCQPPPMDADRESELYGAFDRMRRTTDACGMTFTHVARTWLFVDDILAWYGPLNRVRHGFYTEHGVFDAVVPASTGVGVRNAAGAALSLGAWASRRADGRPAAREVLSPLQCPAQAYGSSFSRAVEIESNALRRVLVSGTASIEPGGASVHDGDIDAQIDLTLEVVHALLAERGLDFRHVTRATAYVRHPGDRDAVLRWMRRLGLEHWPLIITQAVVCRDELLFELEVDAIGPRPAAASATVATPLRT
jgi:enamine deaminase RidA (YjgF/YER057c/UK114 family)